MKNRSNLLFAALLALCGCQWILGIESRSAAPEAAGGPGAPVDGSLPEDGGVAPMAGDVVFLTPESLVADGDKISSWRNMAGASHAKPTGTPPLAVAFGGRLCAWFAGGDHMRMDNNDGGLDVGTGDFRLTALVVPSVETGSEYGRVAVALARTTDPGPKHYSYRGVALLSEYFDIERAGEAYHKFAVRLEASYPEPPGNPTSTVEVVEPTTHAPEALYAVSVVYRTGNLSLIVGRLRA